MLEGVDGNLSKHVNAQRRVRAHFGVCHGIPLWEILWGKQNHTLTLVCIIENI